jgi:hypothetical protein
MGLLIHGQCYSGVKQMSLTPRLSADDGSRIPMIWRSFEVYWTVSYIKEEVEGTVKGWHNLYCQEIMAALAKEPVLLPKTTSGVVESHPRWKILLVSAMWYKFHSVQRILRPFVSEMQKHFDVHLLFAESDKARVEQADTDGFVHVRRMVDKLNPEVVKAEVDWIKSQQFDAIFYPEVRQLSCFVCLRVGIPL